MANYLDEWPLGEVDCLECGYQWNAAIASEELLNGGTAINMLLEEFKFIHFECPQCGEQSGEILINIQGRA